MLRRTTGTLPLSSWDVWAENVAVAHGPKNSHPNSVEKLRKKRPRSVGQNSFSAIVYEFLSQLSYEFVEFPSSWVGFFVRCKGLEFRRQCIFTNSYFPNL